MKIFSEQENSATTKVNTYTVRGILHHMVVGPLEIKHGLLGSLCNLVDEYDHDHKHSIIGRPNLMAQTRQISLFSRLDSLAW